MDRKGLAAVQANDSNELTGLEKYRVVLSLSNTVADNTVKFTVAENCITIEAKTANAIGYGVDTFTQDCLFEGALNLKSSYNNKTVTVPASTLGKLSLPAYTGNGTLAEELYSAGYAATEGLDSEQSVMHLIEGTTKNAFESYVSTLVSTYGYTKDFSNTIDNNSFALLTDPVGQTYYMYYMQKTGESTGTARFILDRSSNVTLGEFNTAKADESGNEAAEFYMFNMNTSNEDTFLIRTKANTWIVIDGGVTDRGTVDTEGQFADSIYSFMREKSGLANGEKVVISAWYMTHAHRDHFLAFAKLIEKYHDMIDLRRIMANVPDHNAFSSKWNSNKTDYLACMEKVREYYPNVEYLKAFTGMQITVAGIELEVLLSQDMMVDYLVENKTEHEIHWSLQTYNGTCGYCDGNACRLGYKSYDFNNTSLVTKITIDGMTVLETGDAYRLDVWLNPYYTIDTLNVDILKVAHHFNNWELVAQNNNSGKKDESKFYWQLLEAKANEEFYALVTHEEHTLSGAKLAWKNAFANSDDHHFIEGSYDYIYCFKKVNGEIKMTSEEADYSARYKEQ